MWILTVSFVPSLGFVDPNNVDPAFERAKKWLEAFKEPLDIQTVEFGDEEPTRIIVKDVERTFTGDEFRAQMTRVLILLDKEFGDYHQGLSFLVSFLGLYLESKEVVAIAKRLNNHPDYIPGYWKHEAADFVRDAYVLDYLLSIHNPAAHAQLARHRIAPGTYPQKWFVALCVHVLPFDALCAFLERLFVRGVRWLFQFGLGFFKVLGPRICQADNSGTIYAYLRLDRTVVDFEDETYMQIIEAADSFTDIPEIQTDEQLSALRKRMYDTYLGKRFEEVKKARDEAFEEEEDEFDFDEDGEAEPGSECEVCHNMAPDHWCFDCKLFVCGMCHDKSREPHSKSHKTCGASKAPPEAYEPRDVEDDGDDDDVNKAEKELSEATL